MFRLSHWAAKATVATTLVVVNVGSSMAAEPVHWSRFRGPEGTGISEAKKVPVNFGEGNVVWQTKLPVSGHSSPIQWGDRIFLTGATAQGDGDGIERHVLCLDAKSGAVLWDKTAAVVAGESLHKMNSWATPSCVTDGERVIAFFGAGGLHCFDNDGEKVWSKQLGTFPGGWGVGASPIIFKETVIQNCDAEGDSYLIALDRKTGNEVWRTPREAKPRGGWSTPIVIDANGQSELILNGEFGVASYDPNTGEPLWTCSGFNGRGTPVPVWGHGLLYVVNGKSGDVYAVRPGGRGDVTETHMAWHTDRRGGRDLPSPILVGECLVAISMSGIATGYDAHTGEELWKERLGGNYSGSPIAAGGRIYALAEDGSVVVLQPGKKFELIAKNSVGEGVGEVFRSSPGVIANDLLIRSDRILYRLK
ncbi:MAG: PQQ-binding-like beta-propeller repeat protein [Rubripirellula sp.]